MSESDRPAQRPSPESSEQRAPFALESWPFYWIAQANDLYIKTMENALRSIELDIPRWRVLMLLDGDRARSVSYLATEAIVKLSTMTRIVQRMKQDNLVTTQPGTHDARVTEVLLTGNGRRARVLAWQQANRIYQLACRDIPEEAVATLNETLATMFANLRSAE